MDFIAPLDNELFLHTLRLNLEPITEDHSQELWELFSDNELHTYTPYEPLTLDKQKERCQRWSLRISPLGDELWINWLARTQQSKIAIGHLQVGIKQDGSCSLGYLISRAAQNQGYAYEAITTILMFLKDKFKVKEVKAWVDTRNGASISLAKKLGMKEVEIIRSADFFKGQSSDEYVFALEL